MPIDQVALQYAQEQLSLVELVTIKRMFGAAGFYARGHFFAIMDGDTLYFKTDDSNRGDYLAAGSPPFAPWGEEGQKLDYYEVPDLVLDNLTKLKAWMEKSIAVANRAKEKKSVKRSRSDSLTTKRQKSHVNVKSGKITKSRNSGTAKKPGGKSPIKKAKRNST